MRQFILRKYPHTPPNGWNFQLSYFQTRRPISYNFKTAHATATEITQNDVLIISNFN